MSWNTGDSELRKEGSMKRYIALSEESQDSPKKVTIHLGHAALDGIQGSPLKRRVSASSAPTSFLRVVER